MRRLLRIEHLAGAAFRSAAFGTLVFAALLTIAGVAAYRDVRATLESELRRQIEAELQLMADIYAQGGEVGLIVALDDLGPSLSLTRRAAGLFREDGARAAGNIEKDPGLAGFGRAAVLLRRTPETAALAAQGDRQYYLGAAVLDGERLVVGRSLSLVEAAERRMIVALISFGVVVTAAALAIGVALSAGSHEKLSRMARALDRVSRGDLSARAPVGKARVLDQIDRIAVQVNGHLDRLQRHVEGARRTAASIAHDLRSPLSRATLGLDRAAAEIAAGRDPATALAASEAELTRLGGIIDTVLRIARIEGDTQRPAAPVDLTALAEDMAETYAPIFEDAGGALGTRIAPGIAAAGDAGMLAQALANLLQNALSHAGPCPRALLTLERRPGLIALALVDEGPGMTAADMARATEAFFRADAARSDEGSGLGLALARAAAERHGAALVLSDGWGPEGRRGLRVEIRLPAAGPED